MIPQIRLAKSGLVTSRLALGTSRFHYVDARTRFELMNVAADRGINHFDTAPSYGDGLAEREVGRFTKGRRTRFIIATKYGVAPDPLIAAMPQFAGPLRGARAILRRAGLWQVKRPPLLASDLRTNVEASLRRLETDHIDILMLHEPHLERLPDSNGLLEELHDLRQRGLIRHFGLAGAWSGIASLGITANEIGEIVQTGEGQWPHDRPPDITYGAIAQAGQSFLNRQIDQSSAAERLRAALARRPDGVVIVSTTKPANLSAMATVAA